MSYSKSILGYLTTLNCVNLSLNFDVELTKSWAYQ